MSQVALVIGNNPPMTLSSVDLPQPEEVIEKNPPKEHSVKHR